MRTNNYQTQADLSRELFLTFDQEAVIRKLKLPHDGEYLYVRFMDVPLRVGRATGIIEGCGDGDTETPIAVYDYLCCSHENRNLSGTWVTTESVGLSFHRGLTSGGLFAQMAQYFDARPAELETACATLGGQKRAPGNVCSVLPLFDELFVWLQFWRGDDEFPAKLTLLWDQNVTQYVHYETLYYIASMMFARLKLKGLYAQ
ncbi:MAG: DUF3786 domain-containing protein [Peptococcaceae bacterium]|jgi:hypothetical protein|nr:DUF3786 domain-containing protein [Peptococcaceae bacterium]